MTDEALAVALLDWYRERARDLPWRRTSDPYAIWVSEIMLQQTRVETVIPYYERFIARWPGVAQLAAAELDDVLEAWSGLGYYRRARQLHEAAGEVVARHGGELPRTAEELVGLTGVGRYTAGAIASIAHGQATPVVDGNVIRVLCRLFGFEEDMRAAKGQRRVWDRAERLVVDDAPGDFNQALMELGATVCTPRRPRCDACPVAEPCVARRQERTEELPLLSKKKPPTAQSLVAVVVRHADGGVLLAQRVRDGLFGGLWEPPMVAGEDLGRVRREMSDHGISSRRHLTVVGRVQHVLSHRRFTIEVAAGHTGRRWSLPRKPPAPYDRLAWCSVGDVAVSTLARKVLALAEEGSRQEALW